MEDSFNYGLRQILANSSSFRIGMLRFRISSYHDSRLEAFNTKEHEHPHYEFAFMRRNRCSYRIAGKHITLTVSEPQICLIPSVISHVRSAKAFSETTIAHLEIDPVLPGDHLSLWNFRDRIAAQGYCFSIPPGFFRHEEELRKLVLARNPYWAEFGECRLKELFLHFFRFHFPKLSQPESERVYSGHTDTIGKILNTISVLTNAPPSARIHAAHMGLSERHLSRLLQAEFGMPLGKFIVYKRIEYAKQLLAGNLNFVKDAASVLGFHDTSHFCRVFRRYTGLTPKQYVLSLSKKEPGTVPAQEEKRSGENGNGAEEGT